MIVHKQCFRTTLSFIVTTTQADRIHIPPIAFFLGMNNRISINFTGRRLKNTCFRTFCQSKHIDCTDNRCFSSTHRIELIMYRGCRTCQIINLIHLHIIRKRHVVAHHLKIRVVQQMNNILLTTCKIIIHTNHIVSVFQQAFTKMRTNKSGSSGN